MNATEKEKVDMNTTATTNQRLITILLVLLIIFAALLILGILAGWSMMGGMMGINGQTMNSMMSGCTQMMQNFQSP